MQETNYNPFEGNFSERLSNYINLDVAKVKRVPQETVKSFENVFKTNEKHAEFFCGVNNEKYGILKNKKYRVVLFFVDVNNKKQCYVSSEVSEKRILNYIQYLKNR